jgi:hypothetical protein
MSAAPSSPLAFPDPKQITISYTNGQISVDNDAMEIDKRKGENIVWVADGDFDFTICFERDSPFASRHFHKHSPASGTPRATSTGRYKYCIEVDGKVLDPDVIVRP